MSEAVANYWRECIAEALSGAGVQATVDQIKMIALDVKIAHQNYEMAFPQPESPYLREIANLETKLRVECDKVSCKECNGTGRIISYGPVHSCDGECWKCRGVGKVRP